MQSSELKAQSWKRSPDTQSCKRRAELRAAEQSSEQLRKAGAEV